MQQTTLLVQPFGGATTAEALLRHRATLPAAHPDRAAIRTRVIEEQLPMAHRMARRYVGRGQEFDDLAQAAALALVRAIDGYDSSRAVPLSGYAIPSIVGSLKRHFRDTAWAMRVPRATQELTMRLSSATDQVSQRQGHLATSAELADHLGVTVAEVVAATGAQHAYRLSSLDAISSSGDSTGTDLAGRLGADDPSYDRVERTLALRPLLAALPPRTRRILELRFTAELTQSQIAVEVGLSQMHVSRLLKRALAQLRLALA